MIVYYVKESFNILQDEGLIKFFKQSYKFLYKSVIFNIFHRIKIWIKYDAIPRRDYYLAPSNINYDYGTKPSGAFSPIFILDGNWDKQKRKWENKLTYQSYVQKYKKNKSWEETTYYTYLKEEKNHDYAIKKLNYYDDILEDIKVNGYNDDKPIKVCICRNGEYMVVSGEDRLCICKVLELDSVPVQINLVHKQWQELRDEICNNGLPEGREALRDHPDLQDILD